MNDHPIEMLANQVIGEACGGISFSPENLGLPRLVAVLYDSPIGKLLYQ